MSGRSVAWRVPTLDRRSLSSARNMRERRSSSRRRRGAAASFEWKENGFGFVFGRRNVRLLLTSALCVLAARRVSFVFDDGFFDQSMPNSRALRRAFASYFFNSVGAAVAGRDLSRDRGGGDCDWLPPEKLNSTYSPPRTLLVSYPGSGKRLTWRMIEALTGFVTGDDWNLSEEGMNVATLKTSYPHHEGIWSWGSSMLGATVVMVLRNPMLAVPSYQTMRYELDYSDSWSKSYLRRPNTYTVRPDVPEWEKWRGTTWPLPEEYGRAAYEIEMWGWFVDFWMKNGPRLNKKDANGDPVQDYHCRPETGEMTSCRAHVVLSFERLYSPAHGAEESLKLSEALEARRPDMPMISREARGCVFAKTSEKRATEASWDNSARDGHGPDTSLKKFQWLQLSWMNDMLDNLIGNYTLPEWDGDPVASDLVGILGGYKANVEAEMSATSPYSAEPAAGPTPAPVIPTPKPSPAPASVGP